MHAGFGDTLPGQELRPGREHWCVQVACTAQPKRSTSGNVLSTEKKAAQPVFG